MTLSRLRPDLNVSPSPDTQNPGILVQDHYRYSDSWLIIPSLLVQGLKFFDGAHTEQDLEAELRTLTGLPDASSIARQLIEGLDHAGFLDNATFAQLRESRHQAFAASPVRKALHAGAAYPNDVHELHGALQSYLDGSSHVAQSGVIGIAAPHVNPGCGAQSYGAAYSALTPDLKDKTFVILGTSHFGQPNRFGLTRKPFETPFGRTGTDVALLDEISAQPAVIMEDYCEVIEHSIEFQVLFLQHLYGADVKILPLLCGHFADSIFNNGKPEDDDVVRRLFGTLGEIAERDAKKLIWIMGVDMAHIGRRYGDEFAVHADQDYMLRVRARDDERIASLTSGDSQAFWEKIKENRDDLRWCGSSPMYTFMQIMPNARGTLRRYDQWNIDAESVVSFAGISFSKG